MRMKREKENGIKNEMKKNHNNIPKSHRYLGVIDAIAIVFLCNTKKENQHHFSFEIWSFSNAYNIHA